MAFLIGVGLAVAAAIFGRWVGFERDRSFYPTVMVVIALLYGLFAVIGGSMQALAWESPFIAGFIIVTVLGYKLNLWLVVAALAGHGVFDCFHGHFISNPGVPVFWPQFCGAYDVTAAVYLGWLLKRGGKARNVAASENKLS